MLIPLQTNLLQKSEGKEVVIIIIFERMNKKLAIINLNFVVIMACGKVFLFSRVYSPPLSN
jgi:hypothetical protein